MLEENDVCILYVDNIPNGFIRIESIEQDIKPGWFEMKFIKLDFPIQTGMWKLDQTHLQGNEFTMNGIPFRIQCLPKCNRKEDTAPKEEKKEYKPGKVIDMQEWRKRLRQTNSINDSPKDIA